VAPSKDPSKDAISAAGDDGRRTESGRSAEARSVLAAIETSVFAARRAETRGQRRRRTADFVTTLLSDA
jgi:hypothetical protein